MFEYYILIAIMFIYLYYFFWISNLEKNECKCSQDYRRTFIKYGAILLLTVNVLASFFMNKFDSFISGSGLLNRAVSNGLIIFLIIYIYMMYTYANDFLNKKNKCKCLGRIELLFIRFHALLIGLLMSFRVVRALCL